MAGVLAGGEGAVLSHLSAAQLWQLVDPTDARPHVTVARTRLRRPGIQLHSSVLPDDERTVRDGIPTTIVPRTILDLAAAADSHRLERAMARAEHRQYAASLSLPDLLERHRGNRGAGKLRVLLGAGDYALGITRGRFENRFLGLLDCHGIPRPELNAPIHLGDRHVEADCMWRAERLIVELDDFRTHGTRHGFESDKERDRALLRRGWKVARITWRQVQAAPGAIADEVTELLRRDDPTPRPMDLRSR